MKIQLIADLYFDGTSMAIEVCELMDVEGEEVLMDLNGVGAKVIQFFRDKGFDVHDLRAETEAIMAELEPEVEPEVEPETEPSTEEVSL